MSTVRFIQKRICPYPLWLAATLLAVMVVVRGAADIDATSHERTFVTTNVSFNSAFKRSPLVDVERTLGGQWYRQGMTQLGPPELRAA